MWPEQQQHGKREKKPRRRQRRRQQQQQQENHHRPLKRRKISPFEETTANSLWQNHVKSENHKTGPGATSSALQQDLSPPPPPPPPPPASSSLSTNDSHNATLASSLSSCPSSSPTSPSSSSIHHHYHHQPLPPPPPPPPPPAVCASPHVTSIDGHDQLVSRRPDKPDAVISALEILHHPVFLHHIRLSLAGSTPTHRPILPDDRFVLSREPGLEGYTAGEAAADSSTTTTTTTTRLLQTSCATDSVPPVVAAADLIQVSAADPTYISPPSSAAPSLPSATPWTDQWSQSQGLVVDSPDMKLVEIGRDGYPLGMTKWSCTPGVREPSSDDSSRSHAYEEEEEQQRRRRDEESSAAAAAAAAATPSPQCLGFYVRSGAVEESSDPMQVKEVKKYSAPRETKRAETVNTRWKRACLRCRIQKLKCVSQDESGPTSECAPCHFVSKTSKKTIHHISCHRGKLLDVVLYRQGGLRLTERWNGTAMKEVGDRCSPLNVSTVHITLGICDEPLKVDVVSFSSRPGDVTARFWYVREGAFGDEVRRKKEIEAYCLASIWKTAEYFEGYIVANAIPAMVKMNSASGPLKGLGVAADQDVIQRTYAAAIEYYYKLDDEYKDQSGTKKSNPEKRLLHNLFVLWFAIRHTTGSAFICGDNKLGMKPELKDETYPLFGRVSVPRMIVAQFDSINHTKMLTKYGRWVLQDLEALFFRNQQRWWWTIYLSVFILLHEASFVSEDRYRHARNNHGTKFRYSIPGFVEELQDGCNNILMHWHYYNCKPWPNPSDPWSRHTHFMSDLSSVQYDLVMETLADRHVQKQLGVWTKYKQENGAVEKIKSAGSSRHGSPYLGSQTLFDWDHPFYWVSQMFEERWVPHPTYQREYVA
ncbi:hypothetical protein CP532_5410 [Ophiocordyceps camponoti-leonardi (nom. inval.)]|nr:hypothetical protein CP532_5410 [Ophiocordyceps camponoti-leonardi (nom. inval.)]